MRDVRRVRRGPAAAPLVRAGSVVAPAMVLANVLQYVLQLVASRALAPSSYGAFGALLGLAVVGSVPLLALQNVAARHVALCAQDPVAEARETGRLLRTGAQVGAAVTGVGLVAAPLVAVFLHVPVLAAVWLAVSLGPVALTGAAQGVLQGAQSFGRLAAVFAAASALRTVGAVGAVLVSPTVTVGLAGTALGTLAGALVAVALTGARRAPAGTAPPAGWARELRDAGTGVLALLVLGGADLLLARHVLPAEASGRYAVGALVSRACFWGPQFVAVLAVPRLVGGDRAVLQRALAVVGGIGAVAVLGALLAPRGLVALLLGEPYGGLAHVLGLFALSGACLAGLQLVLYDAIAARRPSPARLLWSATAAETALVLLLRPGLVGVVTCAAACTAAALVVAVLQVRRAGQVAWHPGAVRTGGDPLDTAGSTAGPA